MLRMVAHDSPRLQHLVAHRLSRLATVRGMRGWMEWRQRAKGWKADKGLSDADIAAKLGVERGTVNSWLNKREPNLSDFMYFCEAMGADAKEILFGAGRSGEHPTRLVDTDKPRHRGFREVSDGRGHQTAAPQHKPRRRKGT